MDLHHLGQKDGKGNFTDLRRLDIHREPGNVQPTPVAGAAIGTKRDQQQEQQRVKQEEQLPVFRQPLQIHRGEEDIKQHTQSGCCQLHNEEAVATQVAGGAGDHNAAESRRQQAQKQQQQVSLFPEIPQNSDNSLHKWSSFPGIGDIVAPEYPNVNRNLPASPQADMDCSNHGSPEPKTAPLWDMLCLLTEP